MLVVTIQSWIEVLIPALIITHGYYYTVVKQIMGHIDDNYCWRCRKEAGLLRDRPLLPPGTVYLNKHLDSQTLQGSFCAAQESERLFLMSGSDNDRLFKVIITKLLKSGVI